MRFKVNMKLKSKDRLGFEPNAFIKSQANACYGCNAHCEVCERFKVFVVYDYVKKMNYELSGKELAMNYDVIKDLSSLEQRRREFFNDFERDKKEYLNLKDCDFINPYVTSEYVYAPYILLNITSFHEKEKKMNKIIEEVYADDKTSDAVLVNKYFSGEIGTSFLYKLQVTQFKKELLAEALRREEESKKK